MASNPTHLLAPGAEAGPLPVQIANTLTGKKENFEPLNPPKVGIYACGVTVYDEVHMGHALQAVFFDVIRRFLNYAGYQVTYVRNYTDVDDKILARAKERGEDPFALAARFVTDTEEVLAGLKVLPPDAAPKVTEHIHDIQHLIERLVKLGGAYEHDGSVYFDVSKFEDYGKLSHQDVETLRENAPPNERGKDDPVDFALWKKRTGDEAMFWESPWGEGRPGWHIECSAMSMKYLGESFDIHGGGKDLVFPHHENEIAQSECATGHPYARYWLHNGLITVNGTKMSKSLGNFLTVRDALSRYPALVLRHAILSAHFTSQVEFGEAVLITSTKRIYYFHRTIEAAKKLLGENAAVKPARDQWTEEAKEKLAAFVAALQDNINTATALVVLGDVMTLMNKVISAPPKKDVLVPALQSWLALLEEMTFILDILELEEPESLLNALQDKILQHQGVTKEAIETLVEERSAARAAKDFAKSDELRAKLLEMGVKVMDTKDGSVWQIDPAKV